MRRALLLLAPVTVLVSCVKVDHTGEVDVNHEVDLDEVTIEVIVTVDAAAEVGGEVGVKAEDIAKAIGAGQ